MADPTGNNSLLAAVATGGIAGSFGIGGNFTTGATPTSNPVLVGGVARATEVATFGNAQAAFVALDVVGKQIVMPYANKELMWRLSTSFATAGPITIAPANATMLTYVTGLQISNTGTTSGKLTLTDTATSVFAVPGGANATAIGVPNIIGFKTPLVGQATNTTITGTLSALSTTVNVSLQGYYGQ